MKSSLKLVGVIGILLITAGLIMPGGALAAPPAPGNVYAKGISSTEIGISWSTVLGAQGYNIYRSASETGTYEKIAEVSGADSSYFVDRDADYTTPEVQPIGASAEYYYKVSAYDADGESALSSVMSHTYTDPNGQAVTETLSKGKTLAAAPPEGVLVTDNHNMTVTVKWTAAKEPNITGYNIYRSETSGGAKVKVNTTPVAALEYADSVSFNKDYYYSVAAVDDKTQEGRRSAETWIKPEALAGANVPHVKFQQEAKECGYCHGTHSASGQDLLTKVSESEVCFVCHDGTGSKNATYQEFNGTYSSKHPLGQNGLSCASCHDAHLDSKAADENGNRLYPAILRAVSVDGNMVYKGNEQCYKCHGTGSTLKGGDHKTAFANSVHNLNTSKPASDTEINCSACHEPHAGPNANLKAYKEENSCLSCHSTNAPGGAAPDIYSRLDSGGDSGTRHDVLAADRQRSGASLQCVNCHNPHGVTSANKIVDPDNPAPDKVWTGTQKDFCLKCHDGTFPTDTETLPYAPGVSSGNKALIDIGATALTDRHLNTLDCSACHDSHGTINTYGLKTETISYFSGTLEKGLLTYTWDYQNNGQTIRGVDARFFCNSCHGPSSHIESQSFPTDCLSCHKHGSNF